MKAAPVPGTSPYRAAIEAGELSPRDLALCALLEAGLNARECVDVCVGDFLRPKSGQGRTVIRVYPRDERIRSVRRARFVPLDELEVITLERYLDTRPRALPTEPLLLSTARTKLKDRPKRKLSRFAVRNFEISRGIGR